MPAETRTYLFLNGGETTLSSTITALATSIGVVSGTTLPSPGGGEIAALVLRDDDAGWYEVMYLTARSGNTLTVERAKEDTTARAWPADTIVRHSLTEGFLQKLTAFNPLNYLTSRPYPYEYIEGIDLTPSLLRQGDTYDVAVEGVDLTSSVISGEIASTLETYSNYAVEGIDVTPGGPQSGVLDDALITYSNYAVEGIDVAPGAPQSGVLDDALITYSNYAVEGVDLTPAILSGELT